MGEGEGRVEEVVRGPKTLNYTKSVGLGSVTPFLARDRTRLLLLVRCGTFGRTPAVRDHPCLGDPRVLVGVSTEVKHGPWVQ